MICVRFLEYLINVKAEDNTVFHDRLAGLYLRITMAAKKRGDNGMSIFLFFLYDAYSTVKTRGEQ
jgi:hypothetical protein